MCRARCAFERRQLCQVAFQDRSATVPIFNLFPRFEGGVEGDISVIDLGGG